MSRFRIIFKKMLTQYFNRHGYFCASRPLEVIIGTLTCTICLVSMSMFAVGDFVCGWNDACQQEQVNIILIL